VHRLQPQDFLKKRFIGLWSLLAFQAGFINSIGFLACQRFVSHVTGFGTQVGLTAGEGKYLLALEMLSAPAAFVFGAWFNGWLTVARQSRGLAPRYDWVTLLMPVALAALLIAGDQGAFGKFGEPLVLARDFLFLSSLSFLCGMQNACFATLTRGQIRTTHLTGISTDFGTDLALTLSGQLPRDERRQARKRNFMRASTFLGFSVGALVSALVDASLEYWSLAIPTFTSLVVAGIFYAYKLQQDAADALTKPGSAGTSVSMQTR
jgi:uncharacterized membrane protein YoaK (UPF0700 family)